LALQCVAVSFVAILAGIMLHTMAAPRLASTAEELGTVLPKATEFALDHSVYLQLVGLPGLIAGLIAAFKTGSKKLLVLLAIVLTLGALVAVGLSFIAIFMPLYQLPRDMPVTGDQQSTIQQFFGNTMLAYVAG
jgi:hypothetical protein